MTETGFLKFRGRVFSVDDIVSPFTEQSSVDITTTFTSDNEGALMSTTCEVYRGITIGIYSNPEVSYSQFIDSKGGDYFDDLLDAFLYISTMAFELSKKDIRVTIHGNSPSAAYGFLADLYKHLQTETKSASLFKLQIWNDLGEFISTYEATD